MPAETFVAFAKANHIAVQGTTLVWHQTAPDWFFAGDPNDTNYRAKVRRRLERYVTDVATHFKGRIDSWVVVNEPTSNVVGETYRNSRWYEVLGADYIDAAFRAARAADPDAQLLINDYLTEEPEKRARFLEIIDGMRSRGVPFDGVGHQCHMGTVPKIWNRPLNYTAADVDAALTAVEARGLINHVTEHLDLCRPGGMLRIGHQLPADANGRSFGGGAEGPGRGATVTCSQSSWSILR
ncbi:MAG: endo-1,4-beta-xylanase [Asticcacaulis sp.]|nr:endo-1,4-beta-xylanase [Asticcacaulis sp.]